MPSEFQPDPTIIALGVRQPWAELILRGLKTIEVRSSGVALRGTIYLYASRKLAPDTFATEAAEKYGLDLQALPLGKLVGSVDLYDSRLASMHDVTAACVPAEILVGNWAWQVRSPYRFPQPLIPRFLPYGIWFYPFQRKQKPQN